MVFYYRMYGQLVCSEMEIEAGYPADKGEPDVVIRTIRSDEVMPLEHVVDREFGVVRLRDDTFFWLKNGYEIIIKSNDNTDWSKAIQYLVTECLPAILFQKGIFTIHGSCVEIGSGSVIISGASGSGKSSLANEFLYAGHRLLADDTVGISVNERGVYALPAFPQRKLVVDMVERLGLNRYELIDLNEDEPKYAIDVGTQYCNEPRKLKALVQIYKYPGTSVEMQEVSGAEKLRFLMNTSYEYMLYVNDKIHKEEIMDMVRICNDVPFLVLFRPEKGYTTKEQMQQIITTLQ